MLCIYCKNPDTRVTNSRSISKESGTWRRRYCEDCESTFTTKETANSDNLFVIKRNGRRQRFIYEKLLTSIFIILSAKKKSDNGDCALLAKEITMKVIRLITNLANGNKNIKSSQIVVNMYRALQGLGDTYADQYASYSPFRNSVISKHLRQTNIDNK